MIYKNNWKFVRNKQTHKHAIYNDIKCIKQAHISHDEKYVQNRNTYFGTKFYVHIPNKHVNSNEKHDER